MRRACSAVLLAFLLLGTSSPLSAGEDSPKIRTVTPGFALRGSTVDVAIEGSNLFPYDEVKISRKEINLTPLGGSDSHKLNVRLTVPESVEGGPVTITVKTKAGIVTTDRFSVRLRTPTVSKVKPEMVQRGDTVDLAITGTNLLIAGQDTKVTVDPPMTAKLVGKATDKSLTVKVTVPADLPPGPKPLTIETTDGKFTTSFGVALAPPSISAATPPSVARGADAEVVLAGKNLSGSSAVVLSIPDPAVVVAAKGPPTATSIPLRISVRADAAPGPRLLVVLTPDGVATARLEVTTPVIKILHAKPAGFARASSGDLELAVEGAPGGYVLRVVPADSGMTVAAQGSTNPRVTVSADALPGARTLVVVHPFGITTTPLTVNWRGPSVTAISPAELAPGAEADVLLEGPGLGGATIQLAVPDPGVVVTAGKAPGSVHVVVKADAAPGPRTLFVQDAEGATTTVLTVTGRAGDAPVVSAVSPGRIPRGLATEIVVTGLNLRAAGDRAPEVTATSGNDAFPATVTASTASTLKVRIEPPAGARVGPSMLLVRTPDGTAAAAFSVVPHTPTISSVEPARIARTGETKVTLSGTALAGVGGKGPTVTVAQPDGKGPLPVKVIESTGERLVLAVTPDATMPPGAYLLSVVTTEGGAAIPVTVESGAPVIDAIEPGTTGMPANLVFKIKGRNLFEPGGGAAKVVVSRLSSSSTLEPTVLASSPTELSVRLVTPKGTPVAPHVFLVKNVDGVAGALFRIIDAPMPVITGFEPALGERLTTTVVRIKGTGLLGASEVTFSGTGVTAEVLAGGTDKETIVRVTVAKDAAPGARVLTLVAPGGAATGGETSFTVK